MLLHWVKYNNDISLSEKGEIHDVLPFAILDSLYTLLNTRMFKTERTLGHFFVFSRA